MCWMHILHSVIIAIVLFVVMKFAMKQPDSVAMHRSVLIAALALVYMLLFGMGPPTRLDPNLRM